MRFIFTRLLLTIIPFLATELAADETFKPFTGKICRSKVRMRSEPSLESTIIKELPKDEMLVVIDEDEEFYAVKPPSTIKTYVYRTYIIDNIVEGNHVNVRLEPDTEALVVGQLNTGDHVTGQLSALNSKWFEITPPQTVNFYICKEYIERVGDPSMMAEIEKRRTEVNQLLESTYVVSRTEMEKSYDEIDLVSVHDNLHKIITDYPEFHEQVGRAKNLQATLKEDYLQKKIEHLEAKTAKLTPAIAASDNHFSQISGKMQGWIPVETDLFSEWLGDNDPIAMGEYYSEQEKEAVTLRGIIEPYGRPVRNKPGDYVLLNKTTRLPIAFLYSTIVDLEDWVNQEKTILVSPRSNHNFAFPAYFVLGTE